jgi:hypothetical protein|nr:MAG TPA: hypothetical protein [Caudoviricetes sp.]
MENIYETYARTVCANCKNKKECQEELRRRIDGSIKCDKYERGNKNEGYKEQKQTTAKRNKSLMEI